MVLFSWLLGYFQSARTKEEKDKGRRRSKGVTTTKAKTSMKAKPKQRKNKDQESSKKQALVSEVQSKALSPSGEILSSQDSLEMELSTYSQDYSLQISARLVYLMFCYNFFYIQY